MLATVEATVVEDGCASLVVNLNLCCGDQFPDDCVERQDLSD
jgi:hypothetical protein